MLCLPKHKICKRHAARSRLARVSYSVRHAQTHTLGCQCSQLWHVPLYMTNGDMQGGNIYALTRVVCAQHRCFICVLSRLFQLAQESPALSPAASHWDVIPSHFLPFGDTQLQCPMLSPPEICYCKSMVLCCTAMLQSLCPCPLPGGWSNHRITEW